MLVSKCLKGVRSVRSVRSVAALGDIVQCKPDTHKNMQTRNFHMSKRSDNQLIVGGLVVFTAAASAHYALVAYKAYAAQKEAEAAANPTANTTDETKTEKSSEEKSGFFDTLFARNYYDGGFEEKMTRREAALILGVRESATAERIKDQHRKVLLNNHPDKGGSAYLSSKINEAKDLLMKTKDAGK